MKSVRSWLIHATMLAVGTVVVAEPFLENMGQAGQPTGMRDASPHRRLDEVDCADPADDRFSGVGEDVDQLFDLTNDPDEMRNLAGENGQQTRVSRMIALIKQWQERLGDTTPLRVSDPEPREIDMTGRRRTPDPWQPMWVIEKYFKKTVAALYA